MWSLQQTRKVLSKPAARSWTSRWLAVLKDEAYHPETPKYGFGDPTSYILVADCIKATAPTGAVRHGPECFNFYFPQELDPEFLVIWEGIGGETPWAYLTEPEVRIFLLERIKEGWVFPLNPIWPVRDPGWYEVLDALQVSVEAQDALNAWYPPEAGILEEIESIHKEYPGGFVQQTNLPTLSLLPSGAEQEDIDDHGLASRQSVNPRSSQREDMDLGDVASLAHITLDKVFAARWKSAALAIQLQYRMRKKEGTIRNTRRDAAKFVTA